MRAAIGRTIEAQWRPELVAERLAAAADVLDRLPPERVGAWYSLWPHMIPPAAATERSRKRSPPVVPMPEAIDAMDQVLAWLAWLEPEERRLVWMRAEGLPWKRISHRLGIGRTTAWQRWTLALHKIATRLNAAREQKRPNNKGMNKSGEFVLQGR